MRTFLRPIVGMALALAAWPGVLGARPPATLGDPPPAPTPEEVARLPRRGIFKHGPTGPFTVNTAKREEARNFFNTVYAVSEGFSIGWTGNLGTCTPGTTDAAFRNLVAIRINYFRAMAGIPANIAFDPIFNTKDQAAALIMSANNSLSHFPPTTWTCYSADGYEAAGKSNIALGNAGPDAVTAFIEDSGSNNTVVGHRRWLLYPQTQLMGTGDVPDTGANYAGNAIFVQDGHYSDPRPSTRDNFVSWPPPGFVPYPVIFARWSISFPNANFSSATVTMSTNSVNIPVTRETVANGYGENTLVWYPTSLNPAQSYAWPRPSADTVYNISVQNVTVSGSPRSFSYSVTVFDPQVPGPDTVLPAISGPDQPAVNQSNIYNFAAVTNATAYQWRQTQRVAFTATEGAENDLTYFVTDTAPDYNVSVSSPRASGSFAFHLAHTQPADQILSFIRALLPGTNGQMQFKSRLGWATSAQIANVQVSLDQGSSWLTVYNQAGTGDSGESSFNMRTISLSSFAGRSILVRFNYQYLNNSSRFPQSDPGVGWYIDDISFSNTEELTNPILTTVSSGTNFTFAPTQTGDYALDARAQVYGQYYLEWGPIKRVTAVASAVPSVQFRGTPSVSGNQVQIDFSVTNYRAGMTFLLLNASDLGAGWTTNSSASFQTVVPNSKFRLTTSTGGASKTFYRVQSN